jgi:hypothetical protein
MAGLSYEGQFNVAAFAAQADTVKRFLKLELLRHAIWM